ncbi:MAG: hypothetical protein M4579_006783 [Chaenotheca gracillima]|nr:MAG: hypothetical protein M4579_006783 [Chaenotheca gracillima]
MPELSKQADPAAEGEAVGEEVKDETGAPPSEKLSEEEDTTPAQPDAADSGKKKKKSKKKRVKDALTGGSSSSKATDGSAGSSSGSAAGGKLSGPMVDQLLENNPALKQEVAGLPKAKAEELLEKMNLSDMLTGLAVSGKDQKDMASYKFWKTQPVPKFDEKPQIEEGPIKVIDPDKVPKEPSALIEGFEWVTMDLTNNKELEEVYELLTFHYVEDDEAMFRFNYSVSFLNWALKSPGWKKDWHVGVRVKQSKKLVAFISGVPMRLRIREKTLSCSEINFLCIHKKLRSKRLAPVLIQEITRRCYVADVWQAIYTAGVVLPKPVSSPRYYHRSINWTKLHDVGFSGLPPGSTKARQVTKYRLPSSTSTNGLRPMQKKDAGAVLSLLERYLAVFDIAQGFTLAEVEHWLLDHTNTSDEKVVWAYVVEEPGTHKITDFFSFYCLESSVIRSKKNENVRAAYLFYYASEAAFLEEDSKDRRVLKNRLNDLMSDALVLAKQFNFDVMNALTLLDNPLFLDKQKFGRGDGQLHYYLYNYRAAPIHGGLDSRDQLDEKTRSGIGVAAQKPEELAQQTIIENLDPKEAFRLSRVRNIGIAAHIDSGKTTATERVLFYTGRIKSIHEVRGKDAVGAKMDSMELERERGITIQSAATFCDWVKTENGEEQKYHINLIDTPGHIDFTIEVERALRVLDGAVMILCAVSGVQSQTTTVDRQMRRYNVPRISFINKMDRMGANPFKAIDQINQKLRLPAAAVQVPIGREETFKGVVDIIRMKSVYNEGMKGETIVESDEIPADVRPVAEERRKLLIETLADVDEEIAEMFLDERTPSVEQIKAAIRRATISLKFTPVFIGSALGDTSVQPMLDGVCDYLPNPSEVENIALDQRKAEAPVKLVPYNSLPFVGLAFKLEESSYGQLTYIRVYQGTLKKGLTVFNARTDKKIKIPRIVRMHSNEMEEIQEIGAGEICAVFGVDCASGDTFTDGALGYTMTSMFVPEAVISLSIKPKNNKDSPNFSKAMNRFQREDPTFRVHVDSESQETIISGMGELHLDIYVERMRREYKVDCETGQPQVAYRETLTQRVPFDHTLKKQTGGAGDFARVVGFMEPTGALEGNNFESQVVGGAINEKFLFACEKGFNISCEKGPLLGHRVLGTNMVINDGATHMTDSSEMAFKIATQQAFRKTFKESRPQVLEPLMKTTVTAPNEFQGNVVALLNKRNAVIHDTDIGPEDFTIHCDCSLNNMFGFSSHIRAATQGKGEFSMEFSHYHPAPMSLQKELVAQYDKVQAARNKRSGQGP